MYLTRVTATGDDDHMTTTTVTATALTTPATKTTAKSCISKSLEGDVEGKR